MSPTSSQLSASQRRETARAQALALKERQAAADRRARLITLGILAVVLAVLIGVVVWLFVSQRQEAADAQVEDIPLADVANVPATARDDGGILISAGGIAGGTEDPDVPTVGVHFDYLCPGCAQFEHANAAVLQGFIDDGTANVILYPISILDRLSQRTAYPTRAATAMAWVADRAPAQALAFHTALLANQPQENTAGHTNAEIADLARAAGVPEAVAAGIASGEARTTFGQWVHSATAAATSDPALVNPERGAFTTPAITVDGVRRDGRWGVPETLTDLVADAG